MSSHRVGHHRLDGLLVGDVEPDGRTAHPVSHRLRAGFVSVDDHHRPRSFSREALSERFPDPACAASDDSDFACKFHGRAA